MLLHISIIEALYVIYMFNFFKTKYSFAHPFTYFENKYIFHPVGKSTVARSNICKLGHDISWLIAIFLILRGLFAKKYKKSLLLINKIGILILFIGCLMNFNAVIYMLPIYIIEIILIKNQYNLQ